MTDQTMREMKQVNNEEKKHIIYTHKFRAFASKLFIYQKYVFIKIYYFYARFSILILNMYV